MTSSRPAKHRVSMPQSTAQASPWYRWASNVYVLLIFAIAIEQIPFVALPFNWLETYFHELSHGIAALATGGAIKQIQLFTNGGGLCTTLGGIGAIIAFSGYFGASVWGLLIFSIANVKAQLSRYLTYLLLALVVISTLLWVRDFLTLLICIVIFSFFALSLKVRQAHVLSVVIKLMGLIVLLNSIKSPLYLIDNRQRGDGAALADMTLIPEAVWILIWFAIGLFSLYRIVLTQHRRSKG
ncbi:M50 family metallopeptidase [Thalassotalea maritima]|uniref:M50 family metallopeptidase n=1 Tax=Thalassotalea maritima TaxID=3242416 RepID=UPI0035289108